MKFPLCTDARLQNYSMFYGVRKRSKNISFFNEQMFIIQGNRSFQNQESHKLSICIEKWKDISFSQ